MAGITNFLKELRRRNVFKVGVAYAIVAWLLIQIIVVVETPLHLPDWVDTLTIIFFIIGFPVALLFAWAFELTPEGVKRTHDVASTESITRTTGRKFDFAIIGLLLVAVIFLVLENYVWLEESPVIVATSTETKTEEMVDAPVKMEQKSIAVLPFVNMSSDPEQEYFSDGLSEEILNLLAKNRELKVAGRTSSFAFKGRNEDLREIGKALDVGTVLEGSVRKSGVKLRITAQLINVEDGYHIWSETYDREMTDIFDMQDDIAAKIMAALEIHLGTDKSSRKRPTENMLAYEKFLAARALSSQEQWDSLKSINLLKEAVSLDPSFAEAWEFLAMEYWLKAGVKTLSQNESAILCLDAAEKALALDPSLSIAAAMEFSANPEKGTWHGEIKMLKKAYQEHPDYPLVAIALVADLFSTGYFTEALSYAEHLVTIDPLSPAAQSTYAAALYAVGRIKEADAASQRAADLGEPWGLFDLFISQMLSGDLEAAIVAYESFLKSVGKDPAGAKDWVRAASDPDTGRQFLLDALENQYRGFSDGRWSVFFAFGYLDDFYDELEYNIHPDMIWYDAEPIIFSAMYHRRSGVSAHPRYLPAMELMTITDTWDELGPPDHCNKDSGEWVCN